MNENKNHITFDAARLLAQENAMEHLQDLFAQETSDILSNHYLEAEGCWFFFRNDEIQISVPENGILPFVVYAVSKSGEFAFVYDFRSNQQQMKDYLDLWSLYALGRREDAKFAFQKFKETYQISDV